ncbi:MAG: hypothetical protein ABRQ25_07175 [Clostridiaceae bacterium]
MQKLFNLIKLNMKFIGRMKTILFMTIFAIIYCFWGINSLSNPIIDITTGDIFIKLFGGVNKNISSILDYFNWMGFQLILLYELFRFMYVEFEEKRNIVLPRIGVKKIWIFLNIILIVFRAILCLIVIYITVFIICVFKLKTTNIVTANFINNLTSEYQLYQLIPQLFSLNLLTSITIAIITINIYLIIADFNKSAISSIIIYAISMFWENPYFSIGSNSIFVQNSYFVTENVGVQYYGKIVYFIVIILINFMLTLKVIKENNYRKECIYG